jgi:large subunit ribosomal protein L29
MAQTKLKQLREMSSQDLVQKEKNLKKDLFTLNYQRKVGAVEKPANFKHNRRETARILTILKEREMEDGRNKKRK